MPKYFCEYCGVYLTHSSPGGRYQHSHGRKHINNKIEYYSQFLYEFKQNTYNNLLAMTSKISKGIHSKEFSSPQKNDSNKITQSIPIPPQFQTPFSNQFPSQPLIPPIQAPLLLQPPIQRQQNNEPINRKEK